MNTTLGEPCFFQWKCIELGGINTLDNQQVLTPYRPVLTGVRNQQDSDYCTFISTISSIEARMRLAWHRNGLVFPIPELSVHYLADIQGNTKGGPEKLQECLTIASDAGLVAAEHYDDWRVPIGWKEGEDGRVYFNAWHEQELKRAEMFHRYKIKTFEYIPLTPENETRIKKEIMINGPVIGWEYMDIHMTATGTCRGGKYTGHALSIVGFTHDQNSNLKWFVQESYGVDVGRGGYKEVERQRMGGVFAPYVF